jgi:hypothetical protein
MTKITFEERRKIEKQIQDLKMEIHSLGGQSVHSAFSSGVKGNADIVLLRAEIRRLEAELGIISSVSDKSRRAGPLSYLILAILVSIAVIAVLRGAGIDIPRILGVF